MLALQLRVARIFGRDMDVNVAAEVVVSTSTKLKRRKKRLQSTEKIATASKKTLSRPKSKTKRKSSSSNEEKKGKLRLTVDERQRVAEIDRVKLIDSVTLRVEKELLEHLFPDRLILWEYMKSCNRLQTLVNYSANKYLELYSKCETVADKDTELFLRWLDVMRSLTCEEKQTEETKILLNQVLDNCGVKNQTKQSLVAIVLNGVFLGISHQMATRVESLSVARHESIEKDEPFKPSDDVALHRICGWALKSASDHLKTHSRLDSGELNLIDSLKLPQSDKHLLPKSVQYLDRGGLTFMKPSFWPWMNAAELKIIEYLNQKSYGMYGEKIFLVTHTAVSSDQTLLDQFQVGVTESGIKTTIDTVESVHKTLLDKLCNARCNEFLRTIGKLACIDKNKDLDGSVSLRDELKVYALKQVHPLSS